MLFSSFFILFHFLTLNLFFHYDFASSTNVVFFFFSLFISHFCHIFSFFFLFSIFLVAVNIQHGDIRVTFREEKKSLMIVCYNNNKGENCIVLFSIGRVLGTFWMVHTLSLYRYQKSWCVLNFGCQFYVISCASALAVCLCIEIALQRRSSGCSSEIQIYGKNMVRPVNERLNQERHVKSQTSENSLSSKFGDDA